MCEKGLGLDELPPLLGREEIWVMSWIPVGTNYSNRSKKIQNGKIGEQRGITMAKKLMSQTNFSSSQFLMNGFSEIQ
jgi:hypothetical protein